MPSRDHTASLTTQPVLSRISPFAGFYFGSGLQPVPKTHYSSVICSISHPFSRGSVHIASADPKAPPAIDPSTSYLISPSCLPSTTERTHLLTHLSPPCALHNTTPHIRPPAARRLPLEPARPRAAPRRAQSRAQAVRHRAAPVVRRVAVLPYGGAERVGRGAGRVHQEPLRLFVPPARVRGDAPARGRRGRRSAAEGVWDGERARGECLSDSGGVRRLTDCVRVLSRRTPRSCPWSVSFFRLWSSVR